MNTTDTTIILETSLRFAALAEEILKDCSIDKYYECEIVRAGSDTWLFYIADDEQKVEIQCSIEYMLTTAGITEFELF
jgi:hypothetical protein